MNHLPAHLLQHIKEQQENLQREYQVMLSKQKARKIDDICSSTAVSQEEAECALNLCENDELEAINRLATESSFKMKVQEMALGTSERFDGEEGVEVLSRGTRRQARPEDDDSDLSDESEGDGSAPRRRKKRRSTLPKAEKVPKLKSHVEGFNIDGNPRAPTIRLGDALKRLEEIKKAQQLEEQQKLKESPRKSPTRKSPRKSPKKETQEEPLVVPSPKKSVATKSSSPKKKPAAAAVSPSTGASSSTKKLKEKVEVDYTFEDLKQLEWSDARIKAFLGRKSNPNAYYYRFNDPGEVQRTGGWTKEEHERFMELIKDGVDYHWGIFSMKTPGRVGYQCSNYYRKLISDGKVVDPNYTVDEKGKLTFSKGVKRYRPGGSDSEEGGGATKPTIKDASVGSGTRKKKSSSSSKKSSRRKRRSRGDDLSSLDSGETTSSEEEEDDAEGKEYLLEDMVDAMTLKPMPLPAISPFGHVLDYSTWLRLLQETPQNTCPFTKQRVTRRDLIKLNKENIQEYRDRIVHVQFDLGPKASAAAASSSPTVDVAATAEDKKSPSKRSQQSKSVADEVEDDDFEEEVEESGSDQE